MMPSNHRPATPGDILKSAFLEPLSLSPEQLADAIGLADDVISEIVDGKCSVTPDIAIRLARFFNTSPEFWINLQNIIDLYHAFENNKKDYELIHPLMIN